jgi:hypothetical protein
MEELDNIGVDEIGDTSSVDTSKKSGDDKTQEEIDYENTTKIYQKNFAKK